MSGNKLNQSLDQIMTDARNNSRRARPARMASSKVSAGPVGGVQKRMRGPKPTAKLNVPTGPSTAGGEGKIMVSNLPMDVTETQVKDYFHSTIGPVKKAQLTYGSDGRSRGSATIIFMSYQSAVKAAKDLDGVKIDKRPMKIELLMTANNVPAPLPPRSLSDRIAKPKPAIQDKPKASAAGAKVAGGRGVGGRGRPAVRRGRNAGRPKVKTAHQLDVEMHDYFGNETGTANGDVNFNGGAVQPVANFVANGVTGAEIMMEDEIM